MDKSCQICNKSFTTTHKRRKYCSAECYHIKASTNHGPTTFKKGQPTWNKGIKGLQHSPATQFKKGAVAYNKLPVGTIRIRTFKKKRRSWQKIAEPNVWQLQAIIVWESQNGKLPKGCVVHHEDRDSLNDNPSNLICLTRSEHINEHRSELKKSNLNFSQPLFA